MEFKFRAVDRQQAPQPSPPPLSATASAINQFPQQFQASQGCPRLAGGSGSSAVVIHGTSDTELSMQREIENARIREEIIMEEAMKARIREEIMLEDAMRWRLHEAQVRREMMLERGIASRRMVMGRGNLLGDWRSPYLFEPSRIGLMHQYQPYDGLSGTPMSTAVETYGGTPVLAVAETHDRSPVLAAGEATGDTPVLGPGEAMGGTLVPKEDRIIELPKPDLGLSSKKRTAESQSHSVGNEDISNKNPKLGWKCDICNTSVYTEKNLQEHLQGKKHKAKEAKLKGAKAKLIKDVDTEISKTTSNDQESEKTTEVNKT